MTVSVADLIAELKALRKGRGIQAPHIGDRIGPAVRAVCGITEKDDSAAARQKVATRLADLAAHLPRDLRIGVSAAFGLEDGPHAQFYKERLSWAEGVLERNTRTVRRRIDDAIAQLAELAVHRFAPHGHGAGSSRWYVAQLRQVLTLDTAVPDALELRRIVAEEDGLAELDLAMTMTAPVGGDGADPPDTGIDVLYGGRLRQRRMESSDRIGYRLALPRPLRLGQEHEFALRFRALGERPMEPHFVCVPRQRCDVCEVLVHFAEDDPPLRVEVLDGVLQRDIADPNSTAELVAVDACGDVRVRFTALTPNLAYGIRWTPGR